MKITQRVCNICGKDITNASERYKFKGRFEDWSNWDDFEFAKWSKMDMCMDCYEEFKDYIRRKLRSKQ